MRINSDRAWKRDTRRMPKWKELKEAYAEYKAKMVANQDKKPNK
jgi:hypothetical protein